MVRAASTASFLKTRIIISFYAVIGLGILEIISLAHYFPCSIRGGGGQGLRPSLHYSKIAFLVIFQLGTVC